MTQLSNIAAPVKTKKPQGGIKGLAVGRKDAFMINPREIEIDPEFNARDFTSPSNKAHVENLAASISVEGVREPLKVRVDGNRVIVTNGESRLRAVMSLIKLYEETGGKEGADIASVPVLTEERFSNATDRLFTQITSNMGKTFEVMEQSDLFAKMVKHGLTVEEIAKRAAMDKRRVQQILDYQSLPFAVQKMVRAETLSAAVAMKHFVENGRDEEKTIAAMEGALENAAAAGKTKVTEAYVGGTGGERKPSQAKRLKTEREELLTLFEGVLVDACELTKEEVEAGEEPNVTITMSKVKWDRIVEMLGL